MSNSDPDRKPWERRSGETVKSYDRFQYYRDDKDRSHERVANKFKITVGRVSTVASNNDWTERLSAWFDHLSSIEIRKQEEYARKRKEILLKRTAVISDNLFKAQSQAKKVTLKKLDEEGLTSKQKLSMARASVQPFVDIAKLELLMLGEATEISKSEIESKSEIKADIHNHTEFDNMSDEEIMAKFDEFTSCDKPEDNNV